MGPDARDVSSAGVFDVLARFVGELDFFGKV